MFIFDIHHWNGSGERTRLPGVSTCSGCHNDFIKDFDLN